MNCNDKPIQTSVFLETQKEILSLIHSYVISPNFGHEKSVQTVVEELYTIVRQLEEYVEKLQSIK